MSRSRPFPASLTPRDRWLRAADRSQQFGLVALWLLGGVALWAWYAAAMAGQLPLPDLPTPRGSTLGPGPIEANFLVQLGLLTVACAGAWRGIHRVGQFGALTLGSVFALLLTAIPWLMIQNLCVTWEVVILLPSVAAMWASGPNGLRFTLSLFLVSLAVAMIAQLQLPFLAGGLVLAVLALSFAESGARLHRLVHVMPASRLDLEADGESARMHAGWRALGLLAGLMLFVGLLPLADQLVAVLPGSPPVATDGSPASDDPATETATPGDGDPASGGGSGNGAGAGGGSDGLEVNESLHQLGFDTDMAFGDRTGGLDDGGHMGGVIFTVERVADESALPLDQLDAEGQWFADMFWQIDAFSVYDASSRRWHAEREPEEAVRFDGDDGVEDGWVRAPYTHPLPGNGVTWRIRLGPIADRICPRGGPQWAVEAPAMTLSAEGILRFAGDTSKTGVTYLLAAGMARQHIPEPDARHLEVPDELFESRVFRTWVQSLHEQVRQLNQFEQANPFARAMIVATAFREDFWFDMVPDIAPDMDPNIGLLRGRVGYCQHYASLFVIGCRSLGVPARVAIGFAGGVWDASIERGALNSYDAHAWGQVFLPARGWVDIDPLRESKVPRRFVAPETEDPTPTPDPEPEPEPEPDPEPGPDPDPPVVPRNGGGDEIPQTGRPSNGDPQPGPETPVAPQPTPEPLPELPDPEPQPIVPDDPDYPAPPDVDPRVLGQPVPDDPGADPSATGAVGPAGDGGAPGSGPDGSDGDGGANGNGSGSGTSGTVRSVLLAPETPESSSSVLGLFGGDWGDTLTIGAIVVGALFGLLMLVVLWRWLTADQETERQRKAAAAAAPTPFDLQAALDQLAAVGDDRQRVIAAWHVVEGAFGQSMVQRARAETALRFVDRVDRVDSARQWKPMLQPLAGTFIRACYGPWRVLAGDSGRAANDARTIAATINRPTSEQ